MRRKVDTGADPEIESGTGTEVESGTGRKTGTGRKKTGTGTEKKTPGRKSGTGKKKRKYTMSEAALAQRRGNNNLIPASTPEEFDYNTRLINHIISIQEIASHVDKKDPLSLRGAFIAYLQLCQQDGFAITNLAAYAAMGVSHYTIRYWEQKGAPEYRELANFVRTVCGLSREQQISDSKINPVIGIFWQRNFDGLRNDTEQIQTIDSGTTDDSETTAGEYVKRYGKLLDE